MADPLSLLRQYNINKKEIIERNNQIIFGKFSWQKNVKTNYLTYRSRKGNTFKEYYTLECLLFLLKHLQVTHSIYSRQANAENIPIVYRIDRMDILAYLNGEIVTSAAIDKFAPLEIPTLMKRAAEDDLESDSKKPRFEENRLEKVKEQLPARLEALKETSITIDNIKSLSEVMPIEEIMAIRTKRLSKKRTSIRRIEENNLDISALRITLDKNVDDTEDIVSHERQCQTRTTVLQATNEILGKNVLAILQKLETREEVQQKGPVVPTPMVTPSSTPMRSLPQGAVYNRYGQNCHILRTEGFKIDTMATYHGMALNSVMEGTDPTTRKSPTNLSTTLTSGLLPTSAAKLTAQQAAQNKRLSRIPIIIIPTYYNYANTSLITMYNVKEILQDLRYVSNEDKRAQDCKRKNEIFLGRRKEGGPNVLYQVVDNPQKLTNADWERVVAVFVTGPSWQFKGWPFDGNPANIFSKVCAFHLKYDDVKLNPNVARWAVKVIEVSRTRRHLDRGTLKMFWAHLDRYIIKNKPHLRF